eukprot:c11126_g1_i2.p2 GENE.c11126_g1_i2~~c11126_g1_i2.p2  ORF type:complete len:177 (+),score=40.60 c11126_g1_i2:2-532(+)
MGALHADVEAASDEGSEPGTEGAATDTVDWDEVFGGVVGETVAALPGADSEDDSESVDSEPGTDGEDPAADFDDEHSSVMAAKRGPYFKAKSLEEARAEVKAVKSAKAAKVAAAARSVGVGTKRKRSAKDDDDEAQRPAKAARMSTNKKKVGAHYYESANVKNRKKSSKGGSGSGH